MSEQRSERVGACPSWCRNIGGSVDGAVHAHVSDDISVGDDGEAGTAARMIQLAGSDTVRVVVGSSVVSVEEAEGFAYALLRLVADAQLAEPGLGFVEHLVQQRGMSTGELALAAGLDAERVRAQRSGGAVLTVREFDRLALAAAQLHCLVASGVVDDLDDVVADDLDDDVADDVDDELPTDVPAEDDAAPTYLVAAEVVPEVVEDEVVAEVVEETVAPGDVVDVPHGAKWADLSELVALAGGSMRAAAERRAEPEVEQPVVEAVVEVGVVVEVEPTDSLEPPADEQSLAPAASTPAEEPSPWSFSGVELVELIELGGGVQEKPAG